MLALLDATLGLVPKWVWLALVAALSATSCKLKWDNGQLSIEVEKHATTIAQLETNIARANERSAAQMADSTARIRAAENEGREREKTLMADAASAKSELDRLRVAVASARSPYALRATASAIAPGLDHTDPFPELFLTCSERYIDLARAADGHANDAKTLMDAWPKTPNQQPPKE